MKLLLTSGGLDNNSIINALMDLVGKSFDQTSIAFIPTAANVEKGDKKWLVKQMVQTKNLGLKIFDVVDFSSVPKDVWLARLEAADILLFGGGNTYHLLHSLRISGLSDILPRLLESKIYVGISAGTVVATHDVSFSKSERIYSKEIGEIMDFKGLGLVNFHVRPHLNNPNFPSMSRENIEKLAAENSSETIYAIDDNSAIQVVDDEVTVISEGEWKKFN